MTLKNICNQDFLGRRNCWKHSDYIISHGSSFTTEWWYIACTETFQHMDQFSLVQSLGHIRLFATPWTAGCQASLSITNSQSPPKPMSIVSVMPSICLILCHRLLLLASIFPNIRVFSNESVLRIRWPKYWSFSFSISPSNNNNKNHPTRICWPTLVIWFEIHTYNNILHVN